MRQLDEEIDKAFIAGAQWVIKLIIGEKDFLPGHGLIRKASSEYLEDVDGNSQSTEN